MYESGAAVAIRQRFPLGDTAAPPAVLAGLPGGAAGTVATLKHMKTFVRDALRSPKQEIRETALAILTDAHVPPRHYLREMHALHAFVRDHIRYVKDPVGLELVQAPERTLQIGQGDCDDKSTLLAALLMATGHPARFTAVGFHGGPFSHVLTESKIAKRGQSPRQGKWIPLETIIQKPAGWFPPGVTSAYSLNL